MFLKELMKLKIENRNLRQELENKDTKITEVRHALRNIKECTWRNPYSMQSKEDKQCNDYRLRSIREQVDLLEDKF